MNAPSVEQGPIRPPSEARSLLVRVSRNCPWNRCVFCPVYKGSSYSRRPVEEVLADLDALREIHGDTHRCVFLQDADPLVTRTDDLVRILGSVREHFPGVERITTYARAHTVARRSLEELRRIRKAGLDRLHIGLESGSDRVLEMVKKGVTKKDQLRAGRQAREAGFELSFYIMPGLGGRALSDEHADETASVITTVEPHFTRLRTTSPIPGTPLHEMQERGEFDPLGEVETVREIRRFLVGLEGVATRLESDHTWNLLMRLRGDLPADYENLLHGCDTLLERPEEDQELFVLGRRTGRIHRVEQLDRPGVRQALRDLRAELLASGYTDVEALAAELRCSIL